MSKTVRDFEYQNALLRERFLTGSQKEWFLGFSEFDGSAFPLGNGRWQLDLESQMFSKTDTCIVQEGDLVEYLCFEGCGLFGGHLFVRTKVVDANSKQVLLTIQSETGPITDWMHAPYNFDGACVDFE